MGCGSCSCTVGVSWMSGSKEEFQLPESPRLFTVSDGTEKALNAVSARTDLVWACCTLDNKQGIARASLRRTCC